METTNTGVEPQVMIMHRSLEEAASGGNLQALMGLLDAQNIRAQTMEGNTVLHLVAANGEGLDFEACANHINDRDGNLLSAQNKNGDTPLHLAARAGKPSMVSHLIDLARQAGIMVELLKKENGSKETALHEAVRIGDHGIVLELLTADPELARFPEAGTSALYLAVLLKLNNIVQTLLDKDNDLSFSGPNGQTALHVAVLRGPELTKKLLQWNAAQIDKDLTAKKDENGSTPLHFAAGLPVYFAAGLPVCFAAGLLKAVQNLESVCWQVFRDNTDALYQPDIDGLFPIHHVAASVGAVQTVAMFVEKCGKSASLRDAKGRTFLHVAAEKNKLCVVRYASRSPSLAWIMNMRDNDGNTAMHLAVQAGNLLSFSALFGSRRVSLNLPNAKGQTPRDIAQYKVPPLSFDLNSDSLIRHSLWPTPAAVFVVEITFEEIMKMFTETQNMKSRKWGC